MLQGRIGAGGIRRQGDQRMGEAFWQLGDRCGFGVKAQPGEGVVSPLGFRYIPAVAPNWKTQTTAA